MKCTYIIYIYIYLITYTLNLKNDQNYNNLTLPTKKLSKVSDIVDHYYITSNNNNNKYSDQTVVTDRELFIYKSYNMPSSLM